MILHLYFARRFTTVFVLLSLGFLGFVAVVNLIDLMRDFSGLELSLGRVIGLLLLKLPEAMNQIVPLVVLLATVTLFINLAFRSGT